MEIFNEGNLVFEFPTDNVIKYDGTNLYRKTLTQNAFGGFKAVDFFYINKNTLYAIEVKDFRQWGKFRQESLEDLGIELQQLPMKIIEKVRDSLTGLVLGKFNKTDEISMQRDCFRDEIKFLHVVLHIELPEKYNDREVKPYLSLLKSKLEQLLRGVNKVSVVNKNMLDNIEWTVSDRD
ncbi:hypothetical protein [Avibacterium endocarditidis]|uniref:NERD domain-containing protein n=1 Tax=Avibacterium endocarditidis TaxID=380674 RepID=A0ABX4ZUU1_9PAST|nr:hypothetical protein [Avibacterium endocarditidis]POY42980.1 hypothetical protein C3Z13_01975 [Avibacterium endocarditidis]